MIILRSGGAPTGLFNVLDYGAVSSLDVDSTPGFQAWADAMGQFASDNGVSGAYGCIPAGAYLINGTVTIPPSSFEVGIVVDAHGAYIRHGSTDPVPMFTNRYPVDNADAAATTGRHDMWRWRGGRYRGATVAGGSAFKWNAASRFVMEDVSISNFDTAIFGESALLFRLTNSRVTNCGTYGLLLQHGEWPGATISNTAGHAAIVDNVRFFAKEAQAAQVRTENIDCTITNCVFEGGNPVANIDYYSRNNSSLGSTMVNLHMENEPTQANVVIDARKGGFKVDFHYVKRPPVLDVVDAASIEVQRVPFLTADEVSTPAAPPFVHRQGNGPRPRWYFNGTGRDLAFEATNPANWDLVNGTVPEVMQQVGSFHNVGTGAGQGTLPNYAHRTDYAASTITGFTSDGSGVANAVEFLDALGLLNNQIVDDGVTPHGATAARPAGLNATTDIGYRYFDTTLGYAIDWDGTRWVDSCGGPA